jgi:hypothetical protein
VLPSSCDNAVTTGQEIEGWLTASAPPRSDLLDANGTISALSIPAALYDVNQHVTTLAVSVEESCL